MKGLVAGAVLLVGLGIGGYYVMTARAEAHAASLTAAYEARLLAALDEGLAQQEAALRALSARFEAIDNLKTAQELRLRRFRGGDHVTAARQFGVGRVSGADEIAQLVEAEQLVRLEDTPHYYLQDFDYSVGYVTPETADLLRLIGERFQAALQEQDLPRYRYNISSVLRTAENQRALRQINPNATRYVSAHEFGTTLDVVYHRYEYVPDDADRLPSVGVAALDERLEALRVRAYDALGMRYWQELQGILGRELIQLQDEGVVLVLLEREQPVFHMTLARSTP